MAVSGCRNACSQAGEPLAGSSGDVAVWAGISWPKPLWDAEDVLDSQGLPAALGELCAAQAQKKLKLAVRLFQRASSPSTERVEVVLWRRDGTAGRRDAVPLAELTPLVERFVTGVKGELEPLQHELFVCTDGKHDPCCAQFGRAVYEALRSAVPPGGAVRVAESSHLGGHRFAANCLSLPDAHFYGRLTPEDCPGLLAALREGRPFAPRLRGMLTHGAVEATVDAFLREHCNTDQWRLDGATDRSGSELRVPVRVRTSRGEQRGIVRCVQRVYSAPTSCGEEPVDTERWVAAAIDFV